MFREGHRARPAHALPIPVGWRITRWRVGRAASFARVGSHRTRVCGAGHPLDPPGGAMRRSGCALHNRWDIPSRTALRKPSDSSAHGPAPIGMRTCDGRWTSGRILSSRRLAVDPSTGFVSAHVLHYLMAHEFDKALMAPVARSNSPPARHHMTRWHYERWAPPKRGGGLKVLSCPAVERIPDSLAQA